METCDVSLPHPVEYIDTICLDKSVILTDGCGTATLTTENGESLPVTFIVSQQILDNSNESVKEIIAASDADIIPEAPSESLDSETVNDDSKTVYAVHFPETKSENTNDCIEISENGAVSEDKSVISENSLDNEFQDQSDMDELNSATNLEDFMDVVTTYKCKFCRFSCHWKSGLVSHIRCCHIAEKKCIVTVKSDKEPNIETNTENSNDYLKISENGAVSEVIFEYSLDNELHDQSDMDVLNSAANVEDLMDFITTYKCKFCRFSSHWKFDFVSHIKCCHIAEKKCIVTHISNREPTIVTAKKEEKDDPKASPEEDKEVPAHKIENIFSLNSSKSPELNLSEDGKFSKNPDSETDSEPSSKGSPILERHIFLCGQCSDGFMTLDECKQHMVDAHNIKLDKNMIKPLRKRGRPRTRPYTGVDASSSKESKRTSRPPKNLEDDYDYGLKKKSRREGISDKVFRCTHNGCGHRFSSSSNLHYHYTCHASTGKSFICPECRSQYEHWRGVVMHLWKDHTIDIDLHACTECSYKTFSYFKLDNHKKIHSDERAFACETCGKAFKQISQLRNHIVIHLDRKNLPEKRWYSEQECDICGRKFSDTKCLRKHKQAVHSKLKPFVCSYCGHLSARKAMLELHMRQHTGEKPFMCDHCDYRTGDHNSLRRHRMRHTGAKPYKCPHCPYACIQAISYKTHLRNKHPGLEGLYSCTLCTFKSVSKENYINHMSDHKREAENLTVEATSIIEANSEELLEPISSEQSPAQMQLNDSALQQLEGILPGNITAAQLIYTCLNALSQEGGSSSLPPGVTVNIPPGTVNSLDGTQTITIQLPSSQEMENEPYYLTIQQDSNNTAALVVPSEQNDSSIQETVDLDNVNFVEQSVSGSSLDCSVLHDDDENENLEAANADSLVITHIEPFDDSEEYTTAVIVDDEENDES